MKTGSESLVCCKKNCRKRLRVVGPYLCKISAANFLSILTLHFHRSLAITQVAKDIGVTQKTVSQIVATIEDTCSRYEAMRAEEDEALPYSQIDEVAFATRKYNKGKRSNRGGTLWFLTIAEVAPTQFEISLKRNKWRRGRPPFRPQTREKNKVLRVFSIPLKSRGAAELQPMIKRKTNQRSVVTTDRWKGYSGL